MCAVRGGLERAAERTYLNFNGPAEEQQRLGPDSCRLTDIHLGRLHLLMEYEPPLRQRPECKHHRALHNTPPQPRRHRMRSFAPAAAQLSSAQLSARRRRTNLFESLRGSHRMQGNVRVARAEPPGGGALGKAVSGRAGRARLDVRDRQIAADPEG